MCNLATTSASDGTTRPTGRRRPNSARSRSHGPYSTTVQPAACMPRISRFATLVTDPTSDVGVDDAWLAGGRKASLYYYEVDLGAQTQLFHPTDYVDVSALEARIHDACFAHASQNPAGDFWTKYNAPMLRFRGMEAGCALAEAFVRHEQSPAGRLPE